MWYNRCLLLHLNKLPPPPTPSPSQPSQPLSSSADGDENSYAENIRASARERYRRQVASETPEEREARLAARRRNRAENNLLLQQLLPEKAEARRAIDRARAARASQSRSSKGQAQRQRADQESRARRNNALSAPLHNLAFRYSPRFDFATLPLIDIGKMDTFCEHCQAKRFKDESKNLCCNSGRVHIANLEAPPEPVFSLFSGDYGDSKHFLKHIRRYNACFQMTSFGVHGRIFNDVYMPTFRVQG